MNIKNTINKKKYTIEIKIEQNINRHYALF